MSVTVTTFTCKASGDALREHQCERCHVTYGYQMHRTVEASSSTLGGEIEEQVIARAQREANGELAYQLREDYDLVPCPNCGWYQSGMVSRDRDARCRWLTRAKLICFTSWAVCCSCIAVGWMNVLDGKESLAETQPLRFIFAVIGCLFAALWGALTLLHLRIVARIDLNHTPASDRIEVAKRLGAKVLLVPIGQPRIHLSNPSTPQ